MLRPISDPLDFTGQMESVSLALSRMYARVYADTHQPSGKAALRAGSSILWARLFLGDIGQRLLVEAVGREGRRGILDKFLRDDGITAWRGKVTRSPFPLGERGWPTSEEFQAWSSSRQLLFFLRAYAAIQDTFRTGSDIPGNHPIIIGVKAGSWARHETSGSVSLHEYRASSAIRFPAEITYIEVPRSEIRSTEAILEQAGMGGLPVLAIEDCETYVASLPFYELFAGQMGARAKVAPSLGC